MTHKHSIEELMEVLRFIPERGRFVWRKKTCRKTVRKRTAGTLNKVHGYRIISHEKCLYREHVLVWAFVHGEWPAADIDHKDGNRSNNKLGNLRLATPSQNLANSKRRSSNKSGFKGVFRKRDKWAARITVNYKNIHIGHFSTPEEAHQAYLTKAAELFGEFARAE